IVLTNLTSSHFKHDVAFPPCLFVLISEMEPLTVYYRYLQRLLVMSRPAMLKTKSPLLQRLYLEQHQEAQT
ncbi:TPA: hypothetical protein MIB74_26535, partial [Klebsiella pneumoniae]|nr:hypothetical protein [Klebsiella pneumoniae]